MKSAKEILARSAISMCVSDRGYLENSVMHGTYFSKQDRERQRQLIWKWLNEKGYVDFVTEQEKDFFLLKIGRGKRKEVKRFQTQGEAVEPLLWTLGIIKRMSDYNNWVWKDFHPPLQITANPGSRSVFENSSHSMENLLDKCALKSEDKILLKAMLWHWRAIECKPLIFRKSPTKAKELFIQKYGEEYEKAIDIIFQAPRKNSVPMLKTIFRPFEVVDLLEAARIGTMAQWRYHAFEWIIKDEDWDNVATDT